MGGFADLLGNVSIGVATAFSLNNIFYCFVGVTLGMLVGVLPGLGALAAISLLLPVTFHLDPTSAIVMLAGVFYGTAYGGSTTSILLNLPGEPKSAVSCLDGYPMSQQGRGGVALFMTTAASFIGASIGIVLMMVFSPLIVQAATTFGPAEYFAMMLLGLVAASTISEGPPLKGIAMVVVGLLFGCVGIDLQTGSPRLDFGVEELQDGIGLVTLAMGMFGIGEIVSSVREEGRGVINRDAIRMRSMVPTRDDVRRSALPILRGTAIGSFFGALPGTGGTIASFVSYAVEKKVSREPERFGKGAIEGIVAPEAANNAADQTAFIPTMALGIPGSVVMALMIGALMIHGIVPGPQLMIKHPDLFWGLIISFWIGNVILLVLNIPLIGIWVRLLMVPYHYLYPAILVFVCIGAFSVNNSTFDILLVVMFGIVGYFMRLLDFQPAPLLLGFVLGPMMEENLRRALQLARGNYMIFIDRPISAVIVTITLCMLGWAFWTAIRKGQRGTIERPI